MVCQIESKSGSLERLLAPWEWLPVGRKTCRFLASGGDCAAGLTLCVICSRLSPGRSF